jgi:hypothetical protein
MKNIKVFNNHFVVIADTRISAQIISQDEWEWAYRVYNVKDLKVKFRGLGFYKSTTRPTEEQCLREYFQGRKSELEDSLAKASSEKLTIDKVLEQLDEFENLVEINTVLRTLETPKLADYDLIPLTKETAVDGVIVHADYYGFGFIEKINTVLKTLGKPKLEDYELVALTTSNVVQGARVYSLAGGFGTIIDVNRLHTVTFDVTFDNSITLKGSNLFFTDCKLCVPKKINTVLKTESKFSLGDEVYAKFWDEGGKIVSVSRDTLLVEFGSKVKKLFNKKGEWLGEIPAAEATLQQLIKDTTLRKLIPIPEDVKVGTEVFGGLGKGAIEHIDITKFYPVRVKFGKTRAINYTLNGKSNDTEVGDKIPLKLIQY